MRAKWYSPGLSREVVGKLYHRAKIEGIPMTRLADRLIQKALDTKESIESRRDIAASGGHAGPVKLPVIAPR